MTVSINQLFTPTVLGLASTVLYTCPAAPTTNVLKNGRLRLTNTTGAAVTATLYADVSATASSAANCCLNAQSIPANSFLDIDMPTLKAGDTLRGLAGAAASITAHELGGNVYS